MKKTYGRYPQFPTRSQTTPRQQTVARRPSPFSPSARSRRDRAQTRGGGRRRRGTRAMGRTRCVRVSVETQARAEGLRDWTGVMTRQTQKRSRTRRPGAREHLRWSLARRRRWKRALRSQWRGTRRREHLAMDLPVRVRERRGGGVP